MIAPVIVPGQRRYRRTLNAPMSQQQIADEERFEIETLEKHRKGELELADLAAAVDRFRKRHTLAKIGVLFGEDIAWAARVVTLTRLVPEAVLFTNSKAAQGRRISFSAAIRVAKEPPEKQLALAELLAARHRSPRAPKGDAKPPEQPKKERTAKMDPDLRTFKGLFGRFGLQVEIVTELHSKRGWGQLFKGLTENDLKALMSDIRSVADKVVCVADVIEEIILAKRPKK